MENFIIGLIGFIIGILFGFILFKKTNNSDLILTLNEFKRTIDEYKNQNEINTKEVKEAVRDASKLTKILTTNQNLKGRYGEDCLEAIIKVCYPEKNINYIKQFISSNQNNEKIKPDYLIKLPSDKSVLIDCKLNLEKYIEYKENTDESLKRAKKAEFIKDLNNTINSLSNKKYESADNINSVDFILMYIPLEPVLTLIYTDYDFYGVIKNANEKNIIIVGNSSILTTLRLIKTLWAQDTQEKNINNIIITAQNIYNLIAQHSQNIFKAKLTLEENLKNFNKEYEKITADNKLFKLTQELLNCGISPVDKKAGKKINEIKIHSDFLK